MQTNQDGPQSILLMRRNALHRELAIVAHQIKQTEQKRAQLERHIQKLEQGQRQAA